LAQNKVAIYGLPFSRPYYLGAFFLVLNLFLASLMQKLLPYKSTVRQTYCKCTNSEFLKTASLFWLVSHGHHEFNNGNFWKCCKAKSLRVKFKSFVGRKCWNSPHWEVEASMGISSHNTGLLIDKTVIWPSELINRNLPMIRRIVKVFEISLYE